jgi:hypothetical protein
MIIVQGKVSEKTKGMFEGNENGPQTGTIL